MQNFELYNPVRVDLSMLRKTVSFGWPFSLRRSFQRMPGRKILLATAPRLWYNLGKSQKESGYVHILY